MIADFLSALLWAVIIVYAPFDFYLFFMRKQALQKEKARSVVIGYLVLIALLYLVSCTLTGLFNIFFPIIAVVIGYSEYKKLIS